MIRQRVKAGLKRAVAPGVKLSRPKIDSATERKVRKQLAKGVGILKVRGRSGSGSGPAPCSASHTSLAESQQCTPGRGKREIRKLLHAPSPKTRQNLILAPRPPPTSVT